MKSAISREMRWFTFGLGVLLTCQTLSAADITTVKGRKFSNIHDVMIRGEVFSFSTDTDIVKLKLSDLPPATVDLYQKKQVASVAVAAADSTPETQATHPAASVAQIRQFREAVLVGLKKARQNLPTTLTAQSAYALADLDKAKAQAIKEGKLLGFIMEWDVMFTKSARPMHQGGDAGLAHFHTVFHDALVLVFVRHEEELPKIPDAVKEGFFGPDEGGFAPNMAVTNASATEFICEIPLGGEKSDGKIRETHFVEGTQKMDRYLNGGR